MIFSFYLLVHFTLRSSTEMHLVFGSKTRKRSNLVFEVLNFHHVAIDGNLCMKSFCI